MERVFAAAVLLAFSLVLILGLTPYGAATSPDALRYLDVARNIDAGRGIVLTDPTLESGYRPFTTYPPLYPLALSWFVQPDERAERSAVRMAVVTLFLSAFLLFELLRPALGPRGAVLGALVFLLAQPTLTVFTYAWSESLTIPLLYFSCWCCLRSIEATEHDRPGPHAGYLFLLALGLAALAYTRYIGALFSMLLPYAWLSSRPRGRGFVRHVLAGLVAAGLVGALYLRNYIVSGDLSGETRVPSTKGLTENLVDTAQALFLQIHPRAGVLAAAALVAVILTALRWFRKDASHGREAPDPLHRRHLLRLCWIAGLVYLGGLVALRSLKELDPIDTRFIAPGFALLLIPLLVESGRAFGSAGRSPLGALRLAGSVTLLLLIAARGVGTYGHAATGWALHASPQLALSPIGSYNNFNHPGQELVYRGMRRVEQGRYREAITGLEGSTVKLDDDYAFNRTLATAHAGLGQVAPALAHTRACLELDRDRTLADMPSISRPYWDSPRLYAAGIDYYEQLEPDIPDAWWMYQNIAGLAERLGHAKLADTARSRGEELKRDGPSKANGTPVILVVVDTLRADHLGAYGYGRRTSPNLDAWAASGRLFERAYATSSWTLPSFGSIHTGQLPTRHMAGLVKDEGGKRSWAGLHPGVRTVAEILAARGYATGAVVNNPYLGPMFGLDRGFASYDYFPADGEKTRRADLVVDRSLSWIDSLHGQPFFLLVHLFDPHMSYDAPPPLRGSFTRGYSSRFTLPFRDVEGIRAKRYDLTEDDREFIRAAYDEEIAFVDRELGRFKAGLASRGFLDATLVIVTSDHGEELFDHGGFEHGHALWEELLRVPLLIWGPEVRPGRDSLPVSITDLAPTILEATGLAGPPGIVGVSLWTSLTQGIDVAEHSVFAEGSLYGLQDKVVIRWPYKLLVRPDGRTGRVFNLSVDPRESEDLAPTRPGFVIDLAGELRQRLQWDRRDRPSGPAAAIDAETLEKLRSLGYVQ